MGNMNPETDGDECRYCNEFIRSPLQILIKEHLTCQKGYKIIYTNGCQKCGTPKRKEVADGTMEFCPDWIRSNAYEWD